MFDLLKRNKESATLPVELQEVEELHLLSEQIYFCRRELDLTQEELAELAGMTQAQIANLEAARANPTIRTLVKVANALECRLNKLFSPVRYERCNYAAVSAWTKGAESTVSFEELMLRFNYQDQQDLGGEPTHGPRRKNQTDWLQTTRNVGVGIWKFGDEARLMGGKVQ